MRIYGRGWTRLRPHVFVNDGFLTAREVRHLLGRASEFERSPVADGAGKCSVAAYRTSVSAAVREDATVTRIMQRAAELVGLTYEDVQPLELVRYGDAGAEFTLHHDNGTLLGDGSVPRAPPGWQREYTLFVYLQSPARGGDTAFPALGLAVEPRPAGRAVLFRNAEGRDNDPSAVHAGLPPEEGVKTGLNIWMGRRVLPQRDFAPAERRRPKRAGARKKSIIKKGL